MSDHLSLIILDKLYTTERLKLRTGNTSTHTSQSGSSRRQNVSKFWRLRIIRNTEKTGQNQNWVTFNKVLFTRIGYLKLPWNRNGEGPSLWHSGKLRIGLFTNLYEEFNQHSYVLYKLNLIFELNVCIILKLICNHKYNLKLNCTWSITWTMFGPINFARSLFVLHSLQRILLRSF